MKIRKYTEYKLNPKDENLTLTILVLAGWHKGRNVDISEIEAHLNKNNIELNDASRAFCREFFGLPCGFYFKFRNPEKEKWMIGGYELAFDTSIANRIFDFENEEDKLDFEVEKALVEKHEPKGAVPVADCGFHLGGTLWVGESGKIYNTYYYAHEIIECYQSAYAMFEAKFKQFKTAKKLFVSFSGYAKEWGIAGDFYMKKYLEEYQELED